MVISNNLYYNALVVRYPEGDLALERNINILGDDIGDKLYTVIEGNSLTQLANFFYGDSGLWYVIADKNNIDNIFSLEVGVNLIIPNINRT
jgi:nucleoid-associated protein YgaU